MRGAWFLVRTDAERAQQGRDGKHPSTSKKEALRIDCHAGTFISS